MKRQEMVELTNMCMIYDGDKVLVQNRIKSWKGIAFPGGHVENHESIVDSVVREIKEETGLAISHVELWLDTNIEATINILKNKGSLNKIGETGGKCLK